jgi:purine-binding chemotaxis protein CheW
MTLANSTNLQLCTFALGDLLLGIDVRRVQEVLRHQPTTHVPLAARLISGLINLRGQIVLTIDLAHCLSLKSPNPRKQSMLVVIRSEDGPASLIVDGIRDIVNVHTDSHEPIPETMDSDKRIFFKAAYKMPKQLLLELDPDRILDFVSLNGNSNGFLQASDNTVFE